MHTGSQYLYNMCTQFVSTPVPGFDVAVAFDAARCTFDSAELENWHTLTHTHIFYPALANALGGGSKDEYKLAQSGDATCNGLDSAEVISAKVCQRQHMHTHSNTRARVRVCIRLEML